MKLYTIYKITNKINGKFYIGKHITDNLNDEYMGSGKLIRKAIEKYGKDNFTKEIIQICNTEHDMNVLESVLIDLDNKQSYNLQPGGKGGWNYINEMGLSNTEELKKQKSIKMNEYWTEERRIEKSENMIAYNKDHGTERYTEELKKRYSNKEYIDNHKKIMTTINQSEAKRKDAGQKIKDLWQNNIEFIEKMKNRKTRGSDGSALKKKWEDPIWREYILESRKKKNETK